MHEALNKNLFLVKEHIGAFKAANNYDIYGPETGQIIMECREDNLGFFTKLLRFTAYKRMTPFNIQIRIPNGKQLIRVSRGIAILRSSVQVHDENDTVIGGFKQRFFSIAGSFEVLDVKDNPVCSLKGKWLGWNFRFVDGELELANVTKKWAGIGREFFTSADNYILEISGGVAPNNQIRQLIIAAVMCIDMVLKE